MLDFKVVVKHLGLVFDSKKLRFVFFSFPWYVNNHIHSGHQAIAFNLGGKLGLPDEKNFKCLGELTVQKKIILWPKFSLLFYSVQCRHASISEEERRVAYVIHGVPPFVPGFFRWSFVFTLSLNRHPRIPPSSITCVISALSDAYRLPVRNRWKASYRTPYDPWLIQVVEPFTTPYNIPE